MAARRKSVIGLIARPAHAHVLCAMSPKAADPARAAKVGRPRNPCHGRHQSKQPPK